MARSPYARVSDVKDGFAEVIRQVKALLPIPAPLASFGISAYNPDQLVDTTAQVQAAYDSGIENFAGVTVYINSDFYFRANRRIVGSPTGEIFPKTDGFGDIKGVMIAGPNAVFHTEVPSLAMDDFAIISLDAATPPVITGDPDVDTEAAAARIAAWVNRGTCLTLYADAMLNNCLIVGFNLAYRVRGERVHLNHCRYDCLNGLDVSDVSDVGHANFSHGYPFWLAHMPGIGAPALRHYQTAIKLHDDGDGITDKTDGFQVVGGLAYGWQTSLHLKDVYASRVTNFWCDGPPELSASRQTVGLLTEGDVNVNCARDIHVESHGYGARLEHAGGELILTTTMSNISIQPVVCGTGHSTTDVTIANTGTNSVVKGLDGVGQHDVGVTVLGGAITRLKDDDGVTTDKSRLRVRLKKNVGSSIIDNGLPSPTPLFTPEAYGASGWPADDTAAIRAADAAATAAGGVVVFQKRVYKATDGITRSAPWQGQGAAKLAPFPLTGDDKQYLRPGYKDKLPGTAIIFAGAGSATHTTQRVDDMSSFTYMVKDVTSRPIRDIALVLDTDVYDAGGSLTALGADNSANYAVGRVIADVRQVDSDNVTVWGYFKKAGTAVHSLRGNDDPDYSTWTGGSTMGRYGVALIGSDTNDAFSSGLSGTRFGGGFGIYSLDHHSRAANDPGNPTAVAINTAIYGAANAGGGAAWANVYIDGYTTATEDDIAGHHFDGCVIRTYALRPFVLDHASEFSSSHNIWETPNLTSIPGASSVAPTVTANTNNLSFIADRMDGGMIAGLLAPACGGAQAAGSKIVIAGAGNVGFMTIVARSGISYWTHVGPDGGSGDPAIQLGSGGTFSSTTGWSIRRDISTGDVLDLRWNGASVQRLYTGGGFGDVGPAYGGTKTIASDAITLGSYSYYTLDTEGAAATDNLATINPPSGVTLRRGQLLYLSSNNSARDVTVKVTGGNIRGLADVVLSNPWDMVVLMWNSAFWVIVSFYDNAA